MSRLGLQNRRHTLPGNSERGRIRREIGTSFQSPRLYCSSIYRFPFTATGVLRGSTHESLVYFLYEQFFALTRHRRSDAVTKECRREIRSHFLINTIQ